MNVRSNKNPDWGWNLWLILACVSCCLVGSLLRVSIAREPLWLDEQHTAWVTDGEYSEVATRAAIGNQTPLYFWLVFLTRMEPEDDASASGLALRSVSMMCGLGLLAALGWLVWLWTRNALAVLICLAISSLDPIFIYYATEARPYVLIQFLCVLQVALFFKCFPLREEPGTANSQIYVWLFALVSALMIGTHVTGVWIGFAELMWLALFRSFSGRRNSWLRLIYAGLLSALFCIPWISAQADLLQRKGNWASLSSVPDLLDKWQPHLILLAASILVVCVGQVANRINRSGGLEDPATKWSADLTARFVFALCWVLVPLFCVIVCQWSGLPLALRRYALVGTAAVPVVCAMAVATSRGYFLQLTVATVIFAIAIAGNQFVIYWYRYAEIAPMRFENWADVSAPINQDKTKKSWPVFLQGNVLEDVDANTNSDPMFQDYLLFPVSGINAVLRTDRLFVAVPTHLDRPFTDEHLELVSAHGGAWLIVRAVEPQRMASANALKTAIQARYPGKKLELDVVVHTSDNDVGLFCIRFARANQ